MSDNAVRFRLPRRVVDDGLDGVLAPGLRAGGAGRRVWADGLDGVLVGPRRSGRRIDVDGLDGVRLAAVRLAAVRPVVERPAVEPQPALVEHWLTERFEPAELLSSEVDWLPTERMPTPAAASRAVARSAGAPAAASPRAIVSVARAGAPPAPPPARAAGAVRGWNLGWALALATVAAASIAAVVAGVVTYFVADAWQRGAFAPAVADAAPEQRPEAESDGVVLGAAELSVLGLRPAEFPLGREQLPPSDTPSVVVEVGFPPPEPPPRVDQEQLVTVSYAFNEVESEQAVDLAVTYALACSGTVVVTGHTCALGPADVNDAIGLTRAHDVRYRLVSAGVPRDHIEVSTAGSREPISDNATEIGRRLNRRVTVFCRTVTLPEE